MPLVKPDKTLVKDQLQALQTCLHAWGIETFCAAMLWILAKKPEEFGKDNSSDDEETSSIIVPFRFNMIQYDLFPKLGKNNLFLKPRQVGGTTFFTLIRLLLNAITGMGVGTLLISQNNEYAEKHFRIVKRAYRLIGAVNPYGTEEENAFSISLKQNLLHTATSTRRELIFDQIESYIAIASAEVEESGQGPTIKHVVGSEYSRWPGNPKATLANVRGALVPGGTVDLECTANGASGPFFEACMRAMDTPEQSDAKIHYYSWYWDIGYINDLTPKQALELEKDLTADELKLIAKMHAELETVTWPKAA